MKEKEAEVVEEVAGVEVEVEVEGEAGVGAEGEVIITITMVEIIIKEVEEGVIITTNHVFFSFRFFAIQTLYRNISNKNYLVYNIKYIIL